MTNLQEMLTYNNRFASAKLDAEQMGAESFAQWKTLITNLHRESYKVYVLCESSGMKAEDSNVDKSGIYTCVKVILDTIGEVKNHKLYANEETAITLIGYSGKRGNVDAPELQYCNSCISNAKKELRLAQEINGYNPEAIQALKVRLEELEAQRTELLATADMRYKKPTMNSANGFRLEVEHYFARVINGQMAKTLEELDKEEEERKAKRKANAKARKQAKAQAQA